MPQARNDVLEAIQRGDVTGNSFSFTMPEDGSGEDWEQPEGELPKRTITKVKKVHDLGPVTSPAYADTTVSARCAEKCEPPAPKFDHLHRARKRRLKLAEAK